MGCTRGATGPQGPGTHRSSHSRHCREALPLQMLLSPPLLPSSSASPVTWLSSTQDKTCMSCSSYETRLPRHIASLSDVLCTGIGQREREREYDEWAAEQTDQEGIIELSRLEKTFKISKSNCQHNNIMPAKRRSEVPYLHAGMGTRTVGYKQGAGCEFAEREVQGSRKNDREKRGGGWAESRSRELEKGKTLLWSSRGGRRKKEREGEQGRENGERK